MVTQRQAVSEAALSLGLEGQQSWYWDRDRVPLAGANPRGDASAPRDAACSSVEGRGALALLPSRAPGPTGAGRSPSEGTSADDPLATKNLSSSTCI